MNLGGNLYEGRSIWTPRFRLVSFSAYMDPTGEAEEPSKPASLSLSLPGPLAPPRHTLVRLAAEGLLPSDPLLETIELAEIADKFPSGRGGLGELFARGPPDAFFLVKFWADINMPPAEGPDALYAADTRFGSRPLFPTSSVPDQSPVQVRERGADDDHREHQSLLLHPASGGESGGAEYHPISPSPSSDD